MRICNYYEWVQEQSTLYPHDDFMFADPQWKTYGGRTLLHIATVSEEGTDEGFEKLIELLTTRTELIKTPL